MKPSSEVHFRVIDNGLFLPIARRLARDAAKVSYWTPNQKAFRTLADVIGEGFEIEWAESKWEDKESVDCWVFPDIGFADEQRELLEQNRIVWGAREGERLEVSRGFFLQSLMDTNLPVPKYEKVVGIEALRDYLAGKSDKYIKISKWRGNWETFHWRDWEQDEMELGQRANHLGAWKEEINFYVFDAIKTKIEDGCDSYCIDGHFPSLVIHGVEAKDQAYLGTFQRYADLPEEVRRVSDQFGPILARSGYRNFFSTEVRITEEGESYFIDPTCRAGSPPSQVMTEMIGNYADIIWRGAQGELIDPEPNAKFGVQALLTAKQGRADWLNVLVPDEIERWVKCGFCSRPGKALSFPPDPENKNGDFGWLVAIGDTPQEAIRELKEHAEKLPDGVGCEYAALADLIREVDEAERQGMEFTDQPMPSPSVVVEK